LSALLAQCASAASRVNSRPVRGQPVGASIGGHTVAVITCDGYAVSTDSIGREEWRTKKADVSILQLPAAVRAVRCAARCTRCLAQDALHGIHIGMLNGIA
jgi:hypothetical protein